LPSGSIIAAGYFKGFGYVDHGLLIKVNQHGCMDTIDCIPTSFPNIMIATNELASPDLKVYPNPARHILHIESEEIPIWDKVELLDMTGQVVNVAHYNKEITMEGLPSGVYVLRLWKGGKFWTRKVIRQ
jgi:hypothetical protein